MNCVEWDALTLVRPAGVAPIPAGPAAQPRPGKPAR
jgi:hypothetical protein